jgi:hypothetical protein
MTTQQIIFTIFEILLIGFALWSLFNEDKFYNFEKRLFTKIKKLWEVIR